MNFYEMRNIILGLPNSLLFNYKFGGIKQMFKLPVLISHKTHFRGVKKENVIIPNDCGFGNIKIGINLGPFNRGIGKNTFIYINNNAKIYFLGKANIACDSVINATSGNIYFGKNFTANNGFLCSCEKEIQFGNDVLFGWNCTVIDGDGHDVFDEKDNVRVNKPESIKIKDHIWIGANSVIVKGAYVLNNTVIGEGSFVNKKFKDEGILVAGRPARILKQGINWRR